MDAGLLARKGPARQVFGPFTIDTDRGEVTREGAPVPLRPKTFSLLLYLVDRAGRVVNKQELLDAVWPGVVVTDDSLSQAVSELRQALDDREQGLIRTVSRRGYRLDASVRKAPDTPPLPSPPAGRSRDWRWGLATAVALAIAMTLGVFLFGREALRPSPQAPIDSEVAARRSIVVMPFTDLSEPSAPHVALAVDMDLITNLGRMADTRVVPRGSAAVLGTSAQVDLKRIASELHVRYVVTGSVRRDGEELHITVQLAHTDRGDLMWAGRHDYLSAADWLARRDVLARIANLLGRQVHEAEMQESRTARQSSAAIDRWMRGEYLMIHAKTRSDLQQARIEFEAALTAQPDSSHALAGLAMTHVVELARRWMADRKISVVVAERLARQALEIDPRNDEAQYALRNALIFDGRLDDATRIIHAQLAINPNDAHANRDLALVLMFYGRWQESLDQLDVALRLDPLDPGNVSACQVIAGTALVALHRYDEAIERAQLINEPAPSRQTRILAAAEALRGNQGEARRYAAAMLEAEPNFTIARHRATRGSVVPAYMQGFEQMAEGWRLAGLPEGTGPTR
jgi:DNA-binding winged helix-turn-helix (wHTH) protein/TolB-like protein